MNDKQLKRLKELAGIAKNYPSPWISHNMETDLEEVDGVPLKVNKSIKVGNATVQYKFQ